MESVCRDHSRISRNMVESEEQSGRDSNSSERDPSTSVTWAETEAAYSCGFTLSSVIHQECILALHQSNGPASNPETI